jgi:hypothetical protein
MVTQQASTIQQHQHHLQPFTSLRCQASIQMARTPSTKLQWPLHHQCGTRDPPLPQDHSDDLTPQTPRREGRPREDLAPTSGRCQTGLNQGMASAATHRWYIVPSKTHVPSRDWHRPTISYPESRSAEHKDGTYRKDCDAVAQLLPGPARWT